MDDFLEIERKFLVSDTAFKNQASQATYIKQGYLNSSPHRTVRVRIYGEEAFLTIKGIPDNKGTTRFEWEKKIAVSDAHALIDLCEEGIIEKTRHIIPAGELYYEVDEFYEANEGLIVAEIELQHADQKFDKPAWLGAEVTGDIKYYNSQLSKKPYTLW